MLNVQIDHISKLPLDCFLAIQTFNCYLFVITHWSEDFCKIICPQSRIKVTLFPSKHQITFGVRLFMTYSAGALGSDYIPVVYASALNASVIFYTVSSISIIVIYVRRTLNIYFEILILTGGMPYRKTHSLRVDGLYIVHGLISFHAVYFNYWQQIRTVIEKRDRVMLLEETSVEELSRAVFFVTVFL